MYGAGAGASAAMAIILAASGTTTGDLTIQRATGAAVETNVIFSDGATYFYDPDDTSYYLKMDCSGTYNPTFSIYASSALAMSLDSNTLKSEGNLFIRSDGYARIQSDFDTGNYIWEFTTAGQLSLPSTSTASTTDGTIWYNVAAAATKRLRIFIEGAEYYIPYALP